MTDDKYKLYVDSGEGVRCDYYSKTHGRVFETILVLAYTSDETIKIGHGCLKNLSQGKKFKHHVVLSDHKMTMSFKSDPSSDGWWTTATEDVVDFINEEYPDEKWTIFIGSDDFLRFGFDDMSLATRVKLMWG